jgi:hypothetical protein
MEFDVYHSLGQTWPVSGALLSSVQSSWKLCTIKRSNRPATCVEDRAQTAICQFDVRDPHDTRAIGRDRATFQNLPFAASIKLGATCGIGDIEIERLHIASRDKWMAVNLRHWDRKMRV